MEIIKFSAAVLIIIIIRTNYFYDEIMQGVRLINILFLCPGAHVFLFGYSSNSSSKVTFLEVNFLEINIYKFDTYESSPQN